MLVTNVGIESKSERQDVITANATTKKVIISVVQIYISHSSTLTLPHIFLVRRLFQKSQTSNKYVAPKSVR